MKAHCWFCNSEQEFDGGMTESGIAYGCPRPILQVRIKSVLTSEDEIIHFVCEKCRRRIMQAIAKATSIKNIMAGAAG